jgi:hypothetical protein
MRVWVYYNPAAGEAIIYYNEPPQHFGRRQHDIGPIELDTALIKRYDAAKDFWHEAHAQFVAAVRTAQDAELIDLE